MCADHSMQLFIDVLRLGSAIICGLPLHLSIDVLRLPQGKLWEEVRYSTVSCGSNIGPASSTARPFVMGLALVCCGAMSTGVAVHVDIGLIYLTVLQVTRRVY